MQAVFKIWLIFITVTSMFAKQDAGKPYYQIPRIIGGDLAEPGEFSFVVGLKIHLRTGEVSRCTGTVLDQHTVLTAGHCLFKSTAVTIYVNCTDLRGCTNTRTGIGFVHPNFGTAYNLVVNDIGLVKTEEAIGTEEVALQQPAPTYPLCIAVGYGVVSKHRPKPNTVLHKMAVTDIVRCSAMLVFPRSRQLQDALCSFVQTGKQPYEGDSGGPLLCDNKQVGVTSQELSDHGKQPIVIWFIPYKNVDFAIGCGNLHFTSFLALGSILLCVPMLS